MKLMKTLLQLNTSIFSSDGESSRLASEYVAGWRGRHPQGRVIVRDFARALSCLLANFDCGGVLSGGFSSFLNAVCSGGYAAGAWLVGIHGCCSCLS